ncbi:DUF1127 domain-containing protein [Phyllobacterium salinisoli]|nr:DUF1127 domain-containing protein [Phyllobacterium salinisoli]
MDTRNKHCKPPLLGRLKTLLAFLRAEAERRRALADILARHDEHWLDDVGLTREEARRILKKPLLRRIRDWTSRDER